MVRATHEGTADWGISAVKGFGLTVAVAMIWPLGALAQDAAGAAGSGDMVAEAVPPDLDQESDMAGVLILDGTPPEVVLEPKIVTDMPGATAKQQPPVAAEAVGDAIEPMKQTDHSTPEVATAPEPGAPAAELPLPGSDTSAEVAESDTADTRDAPQGDAVEPAPSGDPAQDTEPGLENGPDRAEEAGAEAGDTADAAAGGAPATPAAPVMEPEAGTAPDPVGEPAGDTSATEPEAALAPQDEPVGEVIEAVPAPVPDPAPAPAPQADPNIAACLDLAGSATAGVPAGAAQAAARRAALIAAAPACTAAAAGEDAPAEVLFLAAEIAQGRRDMATAFGLLEQAAAKTFGPAETRLGDYYLFGLAPGGEDATEAIAHYQAAVALDDPAGMTTLALMHRVGKGVARDATRMVALLGEAADAGYHFAQYRLAQTYLTGEGIPGRRDDGLGIPDPAKAAAFYTAAAEAGNITAALELAALYGDPASGVAENPAEQARLTRMASRAGLPDAIAAMGVLYETGRGVAQNPGVAAGLYVKALESGKVGFESLRKGAPGGWDFETAVAFQRILQERGLYDGALDGVIGPGSAAGARALAGN